MAFHTAPLRSAALALGVVWLSCVGWKVPETFSTRVTACMQDQNVNPKSQDHITFRTCINPRAVKAAEKVGGAAAQYAGLSFKPCLCTHPPHRVGLPPTTLSEWMQGLRIAYDAR